LLKVLLRGATLTAICIGVAAWPAAAGSRAAGGRTAAVAAPHQLAEATKGAEKKGTEKAGEKTANEIVGLVPLKVALADKTLGKKDAPISILAFESLSCPHCKAFHSGAWPTIKKEYIDTGKAKITFHTVFGGVRAQFATMLARCVPDDRHFALIDLLFRNQDRWTQTNNAQELFAALKPIARLVGMNDAQFKSCMENKDYYRGLARLRDELDAKYKIESTPTFVINGKRLIGAQPYSEFDKLMKPMIKAELSGAK
jgi:protein-disulfide isomerase